jgi:ElaB/YqjD/DUF883 family membrane-anchored ribosome-binding protein
MQNDDKLKPSGSGSTHGSGSDTVSAAHNPTSPVGQSPKPQGGAAGSAAGGAGGSHGSGSDTASAAGLAGSRSHGAGSSGAPSVQSSTLASHTSRPLGGAQGTGSGSSTQSSGSTGSSAPSGTHGQQGAAQSAADTARQTAQSVSETARDVADKVQRQARDLYEDASSWASDKYESASRSAAQASRSLPDTRYARQGVERFIQENPVLVGVVGLAAGLVIGALLPRTRQEDRAFGHWADEVREQGVRYARDMTQRGREFVEDAFSGDDQRSATHDNERRGGGGQPGQGRGTGPR